MAKMMHLMQMLIHSASTHTLLAWADDRDQQLEGLKSFRYWQDIAQTLERGCFDGVFFADSPATHAVYKGNVEANLRYGASWPNHDPMPLVAVMAAATERLGIGVTSSTAATSPFVTTRKISTLNYLSNGRVGWNIVTGNALAEHLAYGLDDQTPHDQRYDVADEYMEICYRLWDAIPYEAMKFDKANYVLADPDQAAQIDFKGKYLKCKAVPPVLPSKHGRPVLIQAGSSGRGLQFALQHAEVIFAIQPHVQGMVKTTQAVRAMAESQSRKDDYRLLFGLQPIIASTEAEAKARAKELAERIPLDAILARMSGVLGTDFSKLDPDLPLAEMDTQTSRGLMAATTSTADGGKITLRDAAARWALSVSIPQVIGTPEQIADRMEQLWRESGGDGFNLSPTINPDSVTDFVNQVVPILQRRGLFRTEYHGENFRENIMEN